MFLMPMSSSIQNSIPHPAAWERRYSLKEVDEVAREILRWSEGIPVWLLEGDIGAGKTTLVRAVCQALGVTDPVNSPTFGIVQEYYTGQGASVYHIDGYRLEGEKQLDALGIDDVLQGNQTCFIEWPEFFKSRMDGRYIRIEWVILEGDSRILKLSYDVSE